MCHKKEAQTKELSNILKSVKNTNPKMYPFQMWSAEQGYGHHKKMVVTKTQKSAKSY
jgi:hypothetical protein